MFFFIPSRKPLLYNLNPSKDIYKILSNNGYPFASNGLHFKDAKFGRDAAEVAEDLLYIKPEIAATVITSIPSYQGLEYNAKADEEPGKYHHEFRKIIMDGNHVNAESEIIIRKLAKIWGNDEDSFIYYGSIDTTPLCIRLAGYYCQLFGKTILARQVVNKQGDFISVEESLLKAIDWLEKTLQKSRLGLLEYKKMSPDGIGNQFWKDSASSLVHLDGEYANINAPIAEISVQGLAYDALKYAVYMFGEKYPLKAKLWNELADTLQKSVLALFWIYEEKYFASALDKIPKTGELRKVETPNSNPAELLNTKLFDNLPEDQQQIYIDSVTRKIYSNSFLTSVGIRCRAREFKNIVSFSDYHGSWTVWPKETFDICKGLLRWNFPLIAQQLQNRILNSAMLSGDYAEHMYVDPENNTVYYGSQAMNRDKENITIILGDMVPDSMQAWTLSAVLAISEKRIFIDQQNKRKDWQEKLGKELVLLQPQVEIIKNKENSEKDYPIVPYFIDTKLAESLALKELNNSKVLFET